jgi:predicted transcriptional regulator of viral defense system
MLDFRKLNWDKDQIMTTREVAKAMKIAVADAYSLLSKASKKGIVYKYGYRVKDGWEDPSATTRQCDSLGWERGDR